MNGDTNTVPQESEQAAMPLKTDVTARPIEPKEALRALPVSSLMMFLWWRISRLYRAKRACLPVSTVRLPFFGR